MGIEFKGIHSNSIPATWKTLNMPILPNAKTFTQAAPESDSEHDFSDVNEDGRIHHQDRVIEGTLTVAARNNVYRQLALGKLAKWLMGSWGELRFDDMPGTIWTAKIENADTVSYELTKLGRASVYFRVKPFCKWELNSQAGEILLDSDTPLESDVPLDADLEEIHSFGASTTIEVNNLGNWYIKPIVEVTGTFGYVQIVIGSKIFRYKGGSASNDTIEIDCQKFITNKNDNNDSINTSGNYFELHPGVNEIVITSDGTGEVKFIFDYTFIYGAVIEDA